MKPLVPLYIIMIALVMAGCHTSPQNSNLPPPIIGDDPFNDLAFVGSKFYLTNYDLNEGAGDRVWLYSFHVAGIFPPPDTTVTVDSVSLHMNGQGYVALTAYNNDLFMFSRETGLLARTDTSGNMKAQNWVQTAPGWHPGGLLSTPNNLRALLWNEVGHVHVFALNPDSLTLGAMIDSVTIANRMDFRAVTATTAADTIFLLRSDPAGADYLERLDSTWVVLSETEFTDSLVAGITYENQTPGLWISTEDRKLEQMP